MAARFSQLRELAREFSSGQIARDAYRRDRSAMLDQIALGALVINYREITPPQASSLPTVIIDVGEDEPTKRMPIILGAVLIVALIAGGGWWYLRQETAAPAPLVNVAPKAPGVAVIEEFLLANDWSSAGIAAFEDRWTGLDAQQQTISLNDPAFGRLERELRSRIEDQMSLVSMDASGQVQSEVVRLRSFGERLGVPVP